jgi:hypothetical protein
LHIIVPLVKLVTDAANVALVDKLAHLVQLVMMVAQVNPVLLVHLDNLVNNPLLLANNNNHHHANHAQLDLPAHLDHPDLLEMLDQMATLDLLVDQLPLANLDQKDLLAHLDQMDNLVLLDNLVPLLNPKEFNLDPQDLLEMLDHLAHLDLLDNLVPMELLEIQDQKVPLAPMETLDPMETQVHPDKLDPLVVLEKRVSAPNIAPSTVVSSSKTELADKHLHLFCCSVASDVFLFFSFNCNAHCHCCHASWLCKNLDRMHLNHIFLLILLCAKILDKNKNHSF